MKNMIFHLKIVQGVEFQVDSLVIQVDRMEIQVDTFEFQVDSLAFQVAQNGNSHDISFEDCPRSRIPGRQFGHTR